MTKTLGYTRALLSTDDAAEDAQTLRNQGATGVFVDTVAERAASRPELDACLGSLQPGDVLLVTTAARLSHSVEHFVLTVTQLRRGGVSLRCLTEPALSTTPSHASPGEVLEALEGLRSRLAGLRTRRGLDAAAATGRRPGRPRVMTDDKAAIARELRAQGRSFVQIGRALGVSEAAVRRSLTSSAD
ncbi:recombinase family protein [Microbacterium sp. E-13]|uniref:recombinase family protein n=1 Tax=Microbacterium sp. E-13 TaxID=3404048 RepID=UPI003CECA43B